MIIIFTGYFIQINNGIPSRSSIYSSEKYKQFIVENDASEIEECNRKFLGDQFCKIFDIKENPTAILIGDSHANHFYYGLSKSLASNNKNLLMIARGGCAPLIDIDSNIPEEIRFCQRWSKPLFNFIINNPNIKNIYLSFHHADIFEQKVTYNDI